MLRTLEECSLFHEHLSVYLWVWKPLVIHILWSAMNSADTWLRWMCILDRTQGDMSSLKKPAKGVQYVHWLEGICLFISPSASASSWGCKKYGFSIHEFQIYRNKPPQRMIRWPLPSQTGNYYTHLAGFLWGRHVALGSVQYTHSTRDCHASPPSTPGEREASRRER
jgi:hypothetical protein